MFSPVAHTRWLAAQIPSAVMSIRPATAHFGALEVVPDVLSWLIRPTEPPSHGGYVGCGLKVAVLQLPLAQRDDARGGPRRAPGPVAPIT